MKLNYGPSPSIAALQPLTPAADKLPYYSSGSAATLTDLTSFARTLLDDANQAAARTTLGLTPGTDVAAFNEQTTLQRAFVSITPAQIRALRATPIQLVAAPAAGKLLVFHYAKFFLDYGSVAHNAPNAGDDFGIKYQNGSGIEVARMESNLFLQGTADQLQLLFAGGQTPNTALALGSSGIINQPLMLHNVGAGEFAGTGDSPLKVTVFYTVLTADESA